MFAIDGTHRRQKIKTYFFLVDHSPTMVAVLIFAPEGCARLHTVPLLKEIDDSTAFHYRIHASGNLPHLSTKKGTVLQDCRITLLLLNFANNLVMSVILSSF